MRILRRGTRVRKLGDLDPMTKSWHRHTDRLPLVGPAIVLAVAGTLLIGTTWRPMGDNAIAEIIVLTRGRTVRSSGPTRVSVPSGTPSPLGYALVWLPYELSSRRSSAQLAATVWFNGAIIVFLLAITKRYNCLGLGLMLLGGIVAFDRANRLGYLAIPWNPYLGFVPLVALVVVVWQTVLGRRWVAADGDVARGVDRRRPHRLCADGRESRAGHARGTSVCDRSPPWARRHAGPDRSAACIRRRRDRIHVAGSG